jgi:hypothetical protein
VRIRSFLLAAGLSLAFIGCSVYGEDLLEGSGGNDSDGSNTKSSSAATGGGGSGDGGGGTTTSSSTASSSAMSSSDMSSSMMSSSSTGMMPVVVWINELHYDNAGTDEGEGVELAGTAGADLTGWTVATYNGTNGMVSTTGGVVSLFDTIPNQMNGMGTVWVPIAMMENGGPDGVALIDDAGVVVQFISYEGDFMATGGPAVGVTSVNIVVDEEPAPALGLSLQLTGNGDSYEDFTWVEGIAASPDAINAGQNLQ